MSPFAGATLSSSHQENVSEIYFPHEHDEKKNGIQYGMAKLAYEKAKLESTWRMNFLNGPYLSQYYNRQDVVLKMQGNNSVEFVLNPKYSQMSEKKRKEMFTHPDSAFLSGKFTVTKPRNGMFLLHSVNADKLTAKIVESKIGLFIDIFDTTVSLNQDVVEFALIDPAKPSEFLMYHEDPQNGDVN